MIYILFDPFSRLYKIGFTNCGVKTRVRQIRRSVPLIQFIHKFNGTFRDEKLVHLVFDRKRVCFEWFRLTETDVELFMSLSPEKLKCV